MKPFYLNDEYMLDFTGKCSFQDKEIPFGMDEIEIDVYGEMKYFNRFHAGLYTHFRMSPLMIPFDNVDFAKVESKVLRYVCGHLPIFKEPIEVGYGFRVIPGFANFAINERGNILSYKTGHILSENMNAYGYRSVNIFDPDKENWRQVAVHVLLARAFIKNENPSTAFYVNHVDGVKTNLQLKNLEWTTPKQNSEHAVRTGLVNTLGLELGRKRIGVTVHDIITGESFDYPDLKSACEARQISKNWSNDKKMVNGVEYHRVYNKRYVVTHIGDPLPCEELWSNGTPGAKVPNIGPYQALEVRTGKVIECLMLKEMVMMTGVPYHHITAILDSKVPKKSRGYYFRNVSDEDFPKEFEELIGLVRRSFKLTHKETKEVLTFDSLGKLTKFLSTANETVDRYVRKEREHPVYQVEETTENL